MKRDADLIRKILLEIEEKSENYMPVVPKIEGYSEEEISYHLGLLHQAGLVDALNLHHSGRDHWQVKSLTWQGHEFLDAARNADAWNWAKEQMAKVSSGFALSVLQDLLLEFVRRKAFGGD